MAFISTRIQMGAASSKLLAKHAGQIGAVGGSVSSSRSGRAGLWRTLHRCVASR